MKYLVKILFFPDSTLHKNRRNVMHTDTTSWIQSEWIFLRNLSFKMIGIYSRFNEWSGVENCNGSHNSSPYLAIRKNILMKFQKGSSWGFINIFI